MAKKIEKDQPAVKIAEIGMKQAIIISMITSLTGVITGYYTIKKPVDPQEVQGVTKLDLEGKWKYICTDFNGKYQHGGRFYIEKQANGALLLVGQRMFKDTIIEKANKWVPHNFKPSEYLGWNSNWIYVNSNTQFNFEYFINTTNTKGYCTGYIEKDGSKVSRIDGHFYQLLPSKNLAGQVVFIKISENEYNNPSWQRKAYE